MKTILAYSIFLFPLLESCQDMTDAKINISGGYTFSDQGEGFNAIYGGPPEIPMIEWIKKYSDDGNYISVWQADSSYVSSKNFRYGTHPKDTYLMEDRFYIIDIKQKKLHGPYLAEDFFAKARALKIRVKWEPVVIYN